MFFKFTWSTEESKSKIDDVLHKFAAYCNPRKNVPFGRYRFNKKLKKVTIDIKLSYKRSQKAANLTPLLRKNTA